MHHRVAVVVMLAAVCVAACAHPAAHTPGPSAAAQLVCRDEAADDIAEALGVRTAQAPSPTWAGALYTCRYAYPSAVLVISVKDLPNDDAALAYFTAQQGATSGAKTLPGVGQAAFVAPDGSAVVRKDAEVMRIDVAGLPATFGMPPHPRSVDAITVANVILDCWTEA